ncbi:MAG: YccF domain-containing protein [Gleimia sp.]
MATCALWPFRREVIGKPSKGVGSTLMNIVWLNIVGLWLAIGRVTTTSTVAITIVGILMEKAKLKLIVGTASHLGTRSCQPMVTTACWLN